MLANITIVEEQDVYRSIGEEGFARLIAAFYRRIPNDDVLGPMYRGRELAAAEKRLRDFLIFRFGGPEHYLEQRGHPRLRMRHFPFAVTEAARDHWIELMRQALEEAKLPADAHAVLARFFDSTATFLINSAGG